MNNASVSQLEIIRRDKWLLSSLTWIPVMLAVMIWAIFSQGIARDLPIGVVNLDSGKMSQHLIRYYDATATMKVEQQFSSVLEAKEALVAGNIYAYAVIPDNFEQEIYKQLAPQVSVFYNSQMILVGKLVNAAFLQAQGTFNAEISTVSNLSHGNATLSSAMAKAVPIRTQITPLFNKNSNYAQFLMSAIIPALWQICVVVTTILVLSANLRDRRLRPWLSDQPTLAIYHTLAPYTWVFMLQGFAFLCWFYLGFKWPMNGSFFALLFAQWLTTIACMVMGSLFFFLTLDAARAMSFAGAFTAPSFAFMGITFPVTDMNSLAQFWRSLLPISHYIEAQVSQVSYGQNWTTSISHLLPMLGYLIPAFVVIALAKKHLNTLVQDAHHGSVS
ncbi:multidrug ABC transporter permease [Vibrio galatheae]|uniref:Multidrug ABC transporter permease n=1 Tax=Vibrio galatheae TaxID=579748 RepID=A0A0F4NMP5_9VIBR|nr:ABC transporter permease [Vibrio galatheae]KJY83391.1 multidrug ABC transporter permease [Vibrio galatheae]